MLTGKYTSCYCPSRMRAFPKASDYFIIFLLYFEPQSKTHNLLIVNLPFTPRRSGGRVLILCIDFKIIMNNQLGTTRRPDLAVYRRKRFNRSQDKDAVSLGKRVLSECSSDSNLRKFYKPVQKIEKSGKPLNFLD